MKKFIMALSCAAIICLVLLPAVPSKADSQFSDWTREELSEAFDEVARNYGACEYAIYTYMIEFGQAPESLDALRDSGHLSVLMVNPYTGEDVVSLTEEDYPDGVLYGNLWVSERANGEECHVEAWYIYRDAADESIHLRSMVKRIFIHQSSVDYDYFFNNDWTREEQMTSVYCRQAIDALESYQQIHGNSPLDFESMYVNGVVNVNYINPITGELAVSSEELSAGDYYYRKIDEEGYVLIGWGFEEPVFFATTDEETEMQFYLEWTIEENSGETENQTSSETPIYF